MNNIWPQVPLGDVIIERNQTLSAEKIAAGKIKIISKIGFNTGKIEFRPDHETRTKMITIYPGDLVLSGINAAKGAIAIYNETEKSSAAATIHYGSYQVIREKADIRFLWWLLRSNLFREILAQNLPGGIKTELKAKRLLPIKIPLPLLSEQRRIVEKIERLVGKIEEVRKLREISLRETELLLTSFYNQFFNKRLHNRVKTVPLGDISEIRSGVTLGRQLNGNLITLPYLRVANVQDGYLDLSKVKEVRIREEEFEKWKLEEGDLLLTEGGDWDKLGRGTVWKNEISNCIHQNHIFRVRVNRNEFDPYYLLALTSSPYGKGYFQEASKQTTNLASINQRQLKAFPVYILPLKGQREILDQLSLMKSKVGFLQKKQTQLSHELNALLPSILDKAFKGEL